MNATVKTFSQRPLLWHFSINSYHYWLLALTLSVFLSALSCIYIAGINRQLIAKKQQLLQTTKRLHNQWSQLLLQKSMVANQPHVMEMAIKHLAMKLPNTKNIIIVKLT